MQTWKQFHDSCALTLNQFAQLPEPEDKLLFNSLSDYEISWLSKKLDHDMDKAETWYKHYLRVKLGSMAEAVLLLKQGELA